jgi:hypothetical protein
VIIVKRKRSRREGGVAKSSDDRLRRKKFSYSFSLKIEVIKLCIVYTK